MHLDKFMHIYYSRHRFLCGIYAIHYIHSAIDINDSMCLYTYVEYIQDNIFKVCIYTE